MASRNLPGFLRRSLRVNYDEDEDEEEEESTERQEDHETDHDSVEGEASYPEEEDAVDRSVKAPDSAAPPAAAAAAATQAPPAVKDSLPVPERQLQSQDSSKSTVSSITDSWQDIPKPEPPTREKSYRENQFEKVLHVDVVSMTELRSLGWNGIPPVYRAQVWKLLLGYLPTNQARRQQTLQRKRSEYKDAMAQHYDIDDNSRTLQEQETLRQVLVDVPRTAPEVALFRNDRIKRILNRLLYIWAIRHPASSYVQGINDLATPLIVVFLADYYEGKDVMDGHVMNHLTEERLDELEADVYWCLTNLLAGIQDHYTQDQPGVQRMVMRLEELVNRIDGDLCRHLRDTGIQFLQFSFKWMNCLLLREFQLRCVTRLWDTYISEKDGFEDFHVYVCAAFMCQFSSQLQAMSFDELFGFMQDIPTKEWTDTEIEMLLSQAFVLSTLFGGSDAHLTNNNNITQY